MMLNVCISHAMTDYINKLEWIHRNSLALNTANNYLQWWGPKT